MSCESDAMNSLTATIRDEFSSLKEEIRGMNQKIEDLMAALNENTRAQNTASLITLCEISVKRPGYNIFSAGEVTKIYLSMRDEFQEMGKARSNEEKPKIKSFFNKKI